MKHSFQNLFPTHWRYPHDTHVHIKLCTLVYKVWVHLKWQEGKLTAIFRGKLRVTWEETGESLSKAALYMKALY